MEKSKISIIVDQTFTKFFNRFSIGKETEAIIRTSEKTSSIGCIKKMSSMKVSGEFKFKEKRILELKTKVGDNFNITDLNIGLVDSKKISQIFKLYTGDMWFLIKGLEGAGIEKIFVGAEKRITEIPLTSYVNEKEKFVDTTKVTVFKMSIDDTLISGLTKMCSVIDGNYFYLGFKKNEDDYIVCLIIGDKTWYRSEIELGITVKQEDVDKLKESCSIGNHLKENTDGYDYILRYSKDNLKDTLSVMDSDFEISMGLNIKGGIIISERKSDENYTIDADYGIIPISF